MEDLLPSEIARLVLGKHKVRPETNPHKKINKQLSYC